MKEKAPDRYIAIGKHEDTGLFHGLLYVNKPTPSGMYRPILALSTTEGRTTEQEALDLMLSGLTPEYVKTVVVPKLEKQTPARDR